MKPTGRIDQLLPKHGSLVRAYYQFLHAVLPIDRWEDIGELSIPLPPKREYPVDWDMVRRWSAVCPPLAGVMSFVEDYNAYALKLGWQYAWSRFAQHAHLLDAIEELYGPETPAPSMVMEPGCFTGGLLHFLSEYWPLAQCIGFDVSPVALDVCSQFSDRLEQKNRPMWLEADFAQIKPGDLPDNVGDSVNGGLVIICNTIEAIGKVFTRYPYLDLWSARSRFISYWVNQGCTVLLAERHPDPAHLLQTIVDNGSWTNNNGEASLMKVFKTFITEGMSDQSAIGSWCESNSFVMAFKPATRSKSQTPGKKKRR